MKTRFVGLLLTALIVSGICGTALAADIPNLDVTASLVTTAPIIDGDLSDPAWLTASQMGAKVVLDLNPTSTELIPSPRIGYLAYDANNLYIAFVVFTPDVTQLVTGGASINANDEIEVGIMPPGAAKYLKVTICSDDVHKFTRLLGEAQFANAKSGIRWAMEIAIPFASLGVTPKAGDVWRIGLYGQQMAAGTYSITWNSTNGNFNDVTRYGVLTFGQ